MALSEFLRNLRIGASLRLPTVQSDASAGDAAVISKQLARAALWLTPRATEGFDPDDFPNLTPEQQRDLKESVARFRAIASQVPSNTPVTVAQFREGLDSFNRILEILGPYVEDPEGEQILQILMHMELPDFVIGTYCESDEDSSGDLVLEIWLIVADEAVKSEYFWDRIDAVRNDIDERLRAEKVKSWWHIHVRTVSEHLESLAESEL